MKPSTNESHASAANGQPKPRLAFLCATAFGAGYLKPGPGTWGSIVGVLLTVLTHPLTWAFLLTGRMLGSGVDSPFVLDHLIPWFWLVPPVFFWLIVAAIGVWSGSEVSRYAGVEDPQYVVIDEVSGVGLTLILALLPVFVTSALLPGPGATSFALFSGMSLLNWKYLLAGFLLFRAFDITKPFPCRRLEHLPNGWGIMADDWMAGVYAAICLRLALHFHLL